MNTNEEKVDRRVLKTKKAIRKAMAQLMTEKELNEITVSDIANLADINRKTFYNYYTGVYQLVNEIEDEIVESFAGLLKTTDFEQALADPSIVFDKLYETISKHVEFVDALFGNIGPSSFVSKILNKLIDMTRDAAVDHFKSDPEKTEVIIRFIFAGEIAVYQDWYHSDRKMPIKELSQTVEALCTRGLDSMLAD